MADARHGSDFRSVNWFGTPYTFTPTQAAVVRQLWQAWENGTPDVGQETLLETAGSESQKISDIFKDHPAWNVLVTSQARGAYRLAVPAVESPRPVVPSLDVASLDVASLLAHLLNHPQPLDLSLTVGGWKLTVKLARSGQTDPAHLPLFVPNELQDNILEALDSKALHAEKLAEAIGVSRRSLYRHPGGIKELAEQGAVRVHPRLGYYRPDAPPEELEIEVGNG